MTDQERQRLAAILGMLGSAHAGERSAAGVQAEAFRKKHGLTWAELLATQPEEPAPEPPTPPAPAPPPTPHPAYPSKQMRNYRTDLILAAAPFVIITVITLLNHLMH